MRPFSWPVNVAGIIIGLIGVLLVCIGQGNAAILAFILALTVVLVGRNRAARRR